MIHVFAKTLHPVSGNLLDQEIADDGVRLQHGGEMNRAPCIMRSHEHLGFLGQARDVNEVGDTEAMAHVRLEKGACASIHDFFELSISKQLLTGRNGNRTLG